MARQRFEASRLIASVGMVDQPEDLDVKEELWHGLYIFTATAVLKGTTRTVAPVSSTISTKVVRSILPFSASSLISLARLRWPPRAPHRCPETLRLQIANVAIASTLIEKEPGHS